MVSATELKREARLKRETRERRGPRQDEKRKAIDDKLCSIAGFITLRVDGIYMYPEGKQSPASPRNPVPNYTLLVSNTWTTQATIVHMPSMKLLLCTVPPLAGCLGSKRTSCSTNEVVQTPIQLTHNHTECSSAR